MSLHSLLQSKVVDVLDFPAPGIVFKDISPLLADHEAFAAAVDAVVAGARDDRIDKVVGIEARGFLLAAPAAYHLRAGFVPVRKPGKLPGPTRETSYDLEYGSNVLQVHLDAFVPGERVLVVDDVLATGGTAAAAGRLVQEAGAELVGFSVLLELAALGGRDLLARAHPAAPLSTLLRY
ncbi:MAG: adenine phosphoribosyltransferase [Actinomycetota bacterium]|nr:adenine phosphoribosyltransferase [Actinomycetota bacterium]